MNVGGRAVWCWATCRRPLWSLLRLVTTYISFRRRCHIGGVLSKGSSRHLFAVTKHGCNWFCHAFDVILTSAYESLDLAQNVLISKNKVWHFDWADNSLPTVRKILPLFNQIVLLIKYVNIEWRSAVVNCSCKVVVSTRVSWKENTIACTRRNCMESVAPPKNGQRPNDPS